MTTLYVDTSSSYLYSAIIQNGVLLCEVKKELGHTLSEEALPEIVKLHTSSNITAKDINKIIVVDGPGSFTGIRIGITIAKVYAWSLNIPIITISALEAMAISSPTEKIKVPMLDARRGYVYAAIYDKENKPLMKPAHLKIEDLKTKLESFVSNKDLTNCEEYTIITNDVLESILREKESYNPDILKIVTEVSNRDPKNPHSVNPDYLKLTEAEERKNAC